MAKKHGSITIPREELLPKERAPHRPTKAHSTEKGKRGYDRKRGKRETRREIDRASR